MIATVSAVPDLNVGGMVLTLPRADKQVQMWAEHWETCATAGVTGLVREDLLRAQWSDQPGRK